jgi:hypothetical protein
MPTQLLGAGEGRCWNAMPVPLGDLFLFARTDKHCSQTCVHMVWLAGLMPGGCSVWYMMLLVSQQRRTLKTAAALRHSTSPHIPEFRLTWVATARPWQQ